MAQKQSEPDYLKRAVASLFAFLAAIIIALRPDWLDRPLARTVNSVAARWQDVDRLAFVLAWPTFQTVSVVFLLWLCWRIEPNDQQRARLASGAIAAVLAAMAAHLANIALPTPPKPIFDPAINLYPPSVLGDIAALRATSFVASHSFPSARATLFAGLAIAIVLVRSGSARSLWSVASAGAFPHRAGAPLSRRHCGKLRRGRRLRATCAVAREYADRALVRPLGEALRAYVLRLRLAGVL